MIVVLGGVVLEDVHGIRNAVVIAVVDPRAATRGGHGGIDEQGSAAANSNRSGEGVTGINSLHHKRALAARA